MTFENKLSADTVGYTFVPAIPGYGSRLYLQRGMGMAPKLFIGLNALSIWGGYDKDGENFVSWEFDKTITEKVLVHFINNLLAL